MTRPDAGCSLSLMHDRWHGLRTPATPSQGPENRLTNAFSKKPIPNRQRAWKKQETIEGDELVVIAIQTAG